MAINTSIRSLAIFVLFLLTNFHNCDIPVHCLKSQITGEWTFYLTKAYEQTKKKLYKLGCSHSIPSNQNNAYKAKIDSQYFIKKMKVKLSEDDTAEFLRNELVSGFLGDTSNSANTNTATTGKWTMVYDEGFDVNIDDYSFFAFSKYAPNTKKNPFSSKKKDNYISMCYSTLIGWFHKGDDWGCFFATKDNESPNAITNGEVNNKLLVVEGTVKKQDDNGFDNIRFKENVIQKKTQKNEEEFDNVKHHNSTVDYINKVQDLWTAESYDEFSKMSIKELNRFAGRKREFPKEAKSTAGQFNTKNQTVLNFDHIQQNLKFINNLKKLAKSFKSKSNKNKMTNKNNKKPQLSNINKSLQNLNTNDFARNIKFKSIFSVTNLKRKKKTKSKTKTKSKSRKNKSFDKDYPDLPKVFKRWADQMPPVRNQGKCGSCYAVSTLNMLESRLRIKLGIKEELSLDHILNCSVYNQGCEGGYSYLVLKFAKELELIPKRCEKKHNNKFQCSAKRCKNSHNKFTSYKVKNFGYLGGSYGRCSEELLMREVQKNGPVVVSFEPDYHFMMYKKGIYKSLKSSNWMSKNLQKPEWLKVDHSVTLVGWGFDEVHQKKYWLLLNSWGKHWGENGYFRMVRGEDHQGIESICEFGEVVPEIL